MKKHYINAVLELLLQGRDADVVLKNLASLLEKKGHQKLHHSVLTGVLQELSLRKTSLAAQVTVTSEASYTKLKAAIEEALRTLGGSLDDVQVTYDDTLIGGFIASHKGKLINRSYKEQLVALYRSITK